MQEQLTRIITQEDAEFLRDESRSIGYAASIAFPSDEKDLSAILKDCSKNGCAVTLQGARTGLTAAAVPQGGQIINLSRMNRVRGMYLDDSGHFVLQVEPGVILARLRKQIETRRFLTTGWDVSSSQAFQLFQKAPPQFFTPDPTETTASIGGMAACNASGARSYRYGSFRAHVQGLRVVLADGQTLALARGRERADGRFMRLRTEQGQFIAFHLPSYQMPECKSAAGYYAADDMDAVDLFIGSDGTLGVLSLIEIKLQPLPPIIWGVTCFFTTEEQALRFVLQVRAQNDGHICALEYFDDQVLLLLERQRQDSPAYARLLEPPVDAICAVFCELQGHGEPDMLAALFRLGALMEAVAANPADSWVARTDFDRDQLTFFRHAAPECVNGLIDQRRRQHPRLTKLGTDMAVPDNHLLDVMALYQQDLLESHLEYAIWGHIGNNHVHVNILPRNEQDYQAGKMLYRRWAEQVVAWGGSVAAEHGIGKLKAEYLKLMFGTQALQEMLQVKKALDPFMILGRGNLFGAWTSEMPSGGHT